MNKLTFIIGALSSAYNAISLCISVAIKWGLFANVFTSTMTILCILGLIIFGGLSGLLVKDIITEVMGRRKRKHGIA